MDKLDLQTPDFTSANIARLAELFPNCVTEKKKPDGTVRRAIDFDLLSQELSHDLVEGPQERYRLDWPGKREALALANAPIRKTLRPCPKESVDFESTRNLYIEGDNLDALKLLQETYLGKIKMIYIDPPYNTGNDFIYDDNFSMSGKEHDFLSGDVDEEGNALFDEEKWKQNSSTNGRYHSEWLSMMYPRLKLARNLLREDGVIFISIDDNEVDSLRRLCSEVFGSQNFVAQIIWQKVYAPKNTADWFSEDHDYILVYARNKSKWRPQKLARTAEMEARYKNPDKDPRGPWKAADMSARNRYDAGVYSVTSPSGRKISGPPTGRYWVVDEKKFKALDADNRIWWGNDGNNTPAVKKFLSEVSGGRTPQTLWFYKEVGHTQDAKKTLLKYVPFQHTENVLNSVKPVELLQRMLQLAGTPSDDDIVLDFFGGSASTAHAVLKQNFEDGGNRRFIGVQIPEPLPIPEPGLTSIFEMGLTRLRNYAAELQSEREFSKLDTGFRVLKIDSSNLADVYYQPDELTQDTLALHVDNLKPGRSAEDLLFQVLLDWGVDFALPITEEQILKHRVFFVADNALAACFDPGLDEAFVKELAKRQPLRAVFRDSGYASDAVKINFEQIFKALSPHTEFKTL